MASTSLSPIYRGISESIAQVSTLCRMLPPIPTIWRVACGARITCTYSDRPIALHITTIRTRVSSPCDTVLVHAPFLKTVHIFCMEAYEHSARNAGRTLSSCPNLVSFKFVPALRSRRAEVFLASFELPWNSLSMNSKMSAITSWNRCDGGIV